MHVTTKPENASDLGELATSLAVLVLHDSGKEVTVEHINAITAAAGISGVSGVFAAAFAKAVQGQNLEKLLAGPKPGAGAAVVVPGGAGPVSSSAPVEEEKKKEESEADVGAGGLFGDDDGGDGGDY